MSVILIGLTIAALMFNSIKKIIFGKKDSFTNVKEEFGHSQDSHPFKIAIGSQKWKEANIDNKIYYRLDNNDEGHKEDNNEYQNPGPANHGTGDININYDSFNNELKMDLDNGTATADVDIYYTHYPWGHPDGIPHKLEATKTIYTTKDGETITEKNKELKEKKLYFHSFLKDKITQVSTDVKVVSTGNVTIATSDNISSIATDKIDGVTLEADNLILLTGQGTKTQNGVYKVGTVTAAKTIISKETTRTPLIKVTEGTEKNKNKIFKHPDHNNIIKGKYKGIVLWDGEMKDGEVKNDYGVTTSKPEGLTLNIKNVRKGFEIQETEQKNVNTSIKTSYTIYYVVVWISILVYTIFQKLKGIEIGVTLIEIVPFIIAALLETLLVAQSHASFGVSKDSDNKDNVFRFALAAYVTRVITVSGFFSTILNHVEN